MSRHTIRTLEHLQTPYGPVAEGSSRQEVDRVHPLYRRLIEASPFAVLATAGPGGLDASPRGDRAGFVIMTTRSEQAVRRRSGFIEPRPVTARRARPGWHARCAPGPSRSTAGAWSRWLARARASSPDRAGRPA